MNVSLSHFGKIIVISEKRQLENETASAMEAVALAMLLESNSESEEVEEDYDDLLSTWALAYHAISNSRCLIRGTRWWLPIEEAFAKYLSYPDRSFVVDFRMHRELWVLVDLLHDRSFEARSQSSIALALSLHLPHFPRAGVFIPHFFAMICSLLGKLPSFTLLI